MNANGCDVDAMINIRQKIHQHPEGGFKEFVTHKTIVDTLKSFGVKDSQMKKSAGTGLVVDLTGTAPVDPKS